MEVLLLAWSVPSMLLKWESAGGEPLGRVTSMSRASLSALKGLPPERTIRRLPDGFCFLFFPS